MRRRGGQTGGVFFFFSNVCYDYFLKVVFAQVLFTHL